MKSFLMIDRFVFDGTQICVDTQQEVFPGSRAVTQIPNEPEQLQLIRKDNQECTKLSGHILLVVFRNKILSCGTYMDGYLRKNRAQQRNSSFNKINLFLNRLDRHTAYKLSLALHRL